MSAFTKRLATVLLSAVLDDGRTVYEIETALDWPSGALLETITDHETLSVGDLTAIARVLGEGALVAALEVIGDESRRVAALLSDDAQEVEQ